ncbi:hypothetical protein Hypma_002812 [Hypsizygus marmoreus]|uniref:Uncharacterized protein n=1 Tax=Hypsizygus marmoreus TaxID=39966 RepID=A0A369J396_HYPMA|nr:hypothetical protein Hypma_002812 [Hypsizygus marmoreus]
MIAKWICRSLASFLDDCMFNVQSSTRGIVGMLYVQYSQALERFFTLVPTWCAKSKRRPLEDVDPLIMHFFEGSLVSTATQKALLAIPDESACDPPADFKIVFIISIPTNKDLVVFSHQSTSQLTLRHHSLEQEPHLSISSFTLRLGITIINARINVSIICCCVRAPTSGKETSMARPRLSVAPPRLPSVSVVVSSNAEQYRMVDITGASSGMSIRERLLSKLCIPDESQPSYSIYLSEIGSFAIGGALTDVRLFELCRDYGDSSGSLKFFVSPYPDRPAPLPQASYSPTYYYPNGRS